MSNISSKLAFLIALIHMSKDYTSKTLVRRHRILFDDYESEVVGDETISHATTLLTISDKNMIHFRATSGQEPPT